MLPNIYYDEATDILINEKIEPYLLYWEEKVFDAQGKVYYSRYQPKFLTINGPIKLATPIGSFRQAAISNLYFEFNGLFCGTESRFSKRYS
jgi:hypothetical protein